MNDRTPRTSDDPGQGYDHEYLQPAHATATAAIMEQAELYGAGPVIGEPDTRDVWLNEDTAIDLDDKSAPHITRAFQQVAEGIELIVESITPDGYQMASERENLMWGLVNVFHAQMSRTQTKAATLVQEIEGMRAGQDGTDAASFELEHKIDELRSQTRKRDLFESFRDYAGQSYFQKTGKLWEPRTGTHVSQTGKIAPRIDSREFLRAREALEPLRNLPDGTIIAVTGGKHGPDWHTVFDTLDQVRNKHPDMVLVHGAAPGTQQLSAKWARIRGVVDIPFLPDYDKYGKAAIPRRDEQILKTPPRRHRQLHRPQRQTAANARGCHRARHSRHAYRRHRHDPPSPSPVHNPGPGDRRLNKTDSRSGSAGTKIRRRHARAVPRAPRLPFPRIVIRRAVPRPSSRSLPPSRRRHRAGTRNSAHGTPGPHVGGDQHRQLPDFTSLRHRRQGTIPR